MSNEEQNNPKYDPSEPHTWGNRKGYLDSQDSKKTTISMDMAYNTVLTKREYFAVMAMQGLQNTISTDFQTPSISQIAIWAVAQADALIVELNKEK